MNPEDSKSILARLFDEVLTQDNQDLIDELYDESYEFIVPKLAGMTTNVVQGRENFKKRVTAFRNSFPDVVYSIDSFVSNGEIVATSFTFSGTHTNEFAGFPASNRRVDVTGIHFAQLQNGKIVKTWAGFTNIAEVLAA
ncbi:MAG: ester cyclase [Leptolyngbyaceae cyanobacterium CSU_1_3]|nr:ester cyclase [Leptolyngbyaceae cyanobacterium CSU_1_3]